MNDSRGWKKFIPGKKKKRTDLLSDLTILLQKELCDLGQERTARAYQSTFRGIMKFTGGKDVYLQELSPQFLINYQKHMKEKGNSLNTISFYMRNFRAMYNKGVKKGFYPPSPTSLFREVYTGVDQTPKRALETQQIVKMEKKVHQDKQEKKGKDSHLMITLYYFLFCFYARGMSFVDMVHLKKTDIRGNSIHYKRQKTGGWIQISLTPELKEILYFFAPSVKESEYLFPILQKEKGNLRKQYENALSKQNKNLKRVAFICGIPDKLSTHVARHSWATMAKMQHIPLEIISESLGHTSVKTTAIYLNSFGRKELDKANRKIARVIKKAI